MYSLDPSRRALIVESEVISVACYKTNRYKSGGIASEIAYCSPFTAAQIQQVEPKDTSLTQTSD